ncbi:hypothetical protein [Algisphaera agarilytica]|uniref:Uncharacterized protein n=1 Tax=Algisphaera agarilytica TaxID=1385975 RepID=A0A7X0H4M0_9BACT|nr:hypothetical protein [Algisphaera agarilytica]MBB6429188.1 hypothetical protein [Algisphaera agarilytica]
MPEQGRDGRHHDLTDQEHDLLRFLEDRRHRRGARKANALMLAKALKVRVNGSDDSRKKGVRILVRSMRDKGVPISSDFSGYWIAKVPEDFTRYQDMLRRMGLTHLASRSRSRRSSASKEAAGQRSLF